MLTYSRNDFFNDFVVPCIGLVIGLIIGGILVSGVLMPKPNTVTHQRVLVGTGCEGPSSIAVAIEEDYLPICDAIDSYPVATR